MGGEKPDLSKIVDQLRTVHFTLAVTCLALIMATEFSTPSTVRRAHQDLIGIQDATNSVPVKWIDDVARAAYQHNLAPKGTGQGFPRYIHVSLAAPATNGVTGIQPFDATVLLSGDYSSLEPSPPVPPEPRTKLGEGRGDDEPVPFDIYSPSTKIGGLSIKTGKATFPPLPSISQFAEAWNFLGKPHEVTMPTKLQNRILIGIPSVIEDKGVRISALPDLTADIRPEVAEFGAYTVNQEKGWAYVFGVPGGPTSLHAIPTDVAHYPVNLLATYVCLAHLGTKPDGAPRPLGTFEESFPELNSLTAHYQDLSFEKARAIMEGELARSGAEFEFLGAKFPAESIGSWGLVIIFVLEVYFALHLNQAFRLATLEPLSATSAWIGVYSNWVARILTVASTVIFPCWVAVVIGEFGLKNVFVAPSRLQSWSVRIGEATVIATAVVTCLQLRALWKQAATATDSSTDLAVGQATGGESNPSS